MYHRKKQNYQRPKSSVIDYYIQPKTIRYYNKDFRNIYYTYEFIAYGDQSSCVAYNVIYVMLIEIEIALSHNK